MGWITEEVAISNAHGARHNWKFNHFVIIHLGQWQFHVEVSVAAEECLEFALGQVDLFEQSRELIFAVVFADNVMFCAILEIVISFNDYATPFAIESAGDFGRFESTEVET